MRQFLENALLLALLLLDFLSSANSNAKLQVICADKSPYCKRRSHLCQSNAFRDVMRSLCKRTCNFCEDDRKEALPARAEAEKEPEIESDRNEEEEGTVGGGGGDDGGDDSVEYPEPETDIDVPEEAVTGNLVTFPTLITTKAWKRTVCTDSSSDCEGQYHLCSERNYARLMAKLCPKTCGLCMEIDDFNIPRSHRISGQISSGVAGAKNGMNIWECRDIASDCRESLCTNRNYMQLMQSVCKKTCSFC